MAPKQKRERRTNTKLGRDPQHGAALHRTFGDLEVIDARHDMRIPVKAVDERKGKRGNPGECAIAQACKRELNSSAVVIYKTRAYVDVLGDDGVRRVERFFLTSAARALVEAFDRGHPIPVDGRWFVLRKPAPGKTLDADVHRQRRRRAAIRKGTYTPANGKPRKRVTEPRDFEVRNGTGHWQMIQKQVAA